MYFVGDINKMMDEIGGRDSRIEHAAEKNRKPFGVVPSSVAYSLGTNVLFLGILFPRCSVFRFFFRSVLLLFFSLCVLLRPRAALLLDHVLFFYNVCVDSFIHILS